MKKSLRERFGVVLDQLRPHARSSGGDIEVVDVDTDGVVTARLHGASVGSPSSPLTLRLGIERNLKDQVSEVSPVVCE